MRREEVNVGKSTFGIQLPTCRHSQALDCAEDSATWLKKDARRECGHGKGSKRKHVEPPAADAPIGA